MELMMETAATGMEFFLENFAEINRDCHMSWWTELCQLWHVVVEWRLSVVHALSYLIRQQRVRNIYRRESFLPHGTQTLVS